MSRRYQQVIPLHIFWMFYHGLYFFSKLHSTILTLSTNYEALKVLTVGDGDDEVGW
jgi:hypothetical protein